MRRKTIKVKLKYNYEPPAVLQEAYFIPGESLLAGSIVTDATVTSVGQEINTYDFDGSTFNHIWEN